MRTSLKSCRLGIAIVPILLSLLSSLSLFSFAEDPFRILAPSRTGESLLVIDATPTTDDGLKLVLADPIPLELPGSCICLHPTKRLAYVGGRGKEGAVPGAVIELGKPGSAKPVVHKQNFDHGYCYLSTDREGRFLLGVSYGTGHVDVYSLDGDGMPGKRVASLNEGRKSAHCILPSPDNRFVYIPYVKDQLGLFQYAFDAENGSLKALAPKDATPPEGTGPRHMAYHPTLPIAYFSNEQGVGVSVYDRKADGQLAFRQTAPAFDVGTDTEGVSSSDLVITPDGRYLFVGVRGHRQDVDAIGRYRIKENGEVERLGRTPADKIPWGMTLSPAGTTLLVTAANGETLTAFGIGKDGELRKLGSVAIDRQVTDVVTFPAK